MIPNQVIYSTRSSPTSRIFAQIILGLKYIHEKGVTQRDLKPENILLTERGTVKILDFGLGNIFKYN